VCIYLGTAQLQPSSSAETVIQFGKLFALFAAFVVKEKRRTIPLTLRSGEKFANSSITPDITEDMLASQTQNERPFTATLGASEEEGPPN
jgi:hypothetical protein